MRLPVMPAVKPMLAKAVYDLPRDPGLLYEPKWDGFRCVLFRDGDEVELGSRDGWLAYVRLEDPPGLSPITTIGRFASADEAMVATDEVWAVTMRRQLDDGQGYLVAGGCGATPGAGVGGGGGGAETVSIFCSRQSRLTMHINGSVGSSTRAGPNATEAGSSPSG